MDGVIAQQGIRQPYKSDIHKKNLSLLNTSVAVPPFYTLLSQNISRGFSSYIKTVISLSLLRIVLQKLEADFYDEQGPDQQAARSFGFFSTNGLYLFPLDACFINHGVSVPSQ